MRVPEHFQSKVPLFAAVNARQESLTDNAAQTHGELRPDRRLRVLWEQVGESADRPLGIAGVERGEHKVPGLGGAEGHLRRLAVAHFADQDYVRILPQARAQSVGK